MKIFNFSFSLIIGLGLLYSGLSFSQPGPIKNLRYEDDFSFLQNDSVAKKGLEKLKFIPLSSNSNQYLSFGGELREWYDLRINPNFGDLPPGNLADSDGALLHRFMLHADLKVSKRIRFFTQINNTFEIGSPNDPIPEISQDGIGLHQLFTEFHFGAKGKEDHFFLRLGRQEISFGNELLISSREGPNNRQAFDGANFVIQDNGFQINVLAMTPVIINPSAFDNQHINEYLWGGYAYLRQKKHAKLDAYYLGFNSDRRSFNFVEGTQTRHTLGLRLWKQAPPFTYDVEAMYQFGKFNDLQIQAFSVNGVVKKYFLGKLNFNIGLEGSYITGDKSANDQILNTFDPLYPKPTFGLAAPLGPSNITNIRPVLGIAPNFKLFINASVYFLNRASINDGTYTPGMIQVRPFPGSESAVKSIGTQYALDVFYLPTRNITLLSFMTFFPPGKYVTDTGKGQNVGFWGFAVAYKF